MRLVVPQAELPASRGGPLRSAAQQMRLPRRLTVSRALGVTAATLTSWRDSFLAAGEAALASRPIGDETLESERLKARLGEMLLKHELLEQKITSLEGGRPLVRRRSRR